MGLLWDLYWPAIVAALVIGVIAGTFAYRREPPRKRTYLALAAGLAATLAAMALWHGPAGAAERFRTTVTAAARVTLEYYEMAPVQVRLGSGAVGRTAILSGPADDFQRGELVRIMSGLPGVTGARWTDSSRSRFEMPLLVEMELWALVAFGLGLLLSYLVELRRRARADWRW